MGFDGYLSCAPALRAPAPAAEAASNAPSMLRLAITRSSPCSLETILGRKSPAFNAFGLKYRFSSLWRFDYHPSPSRNGIRALGGASAPRPSPS
jgi:hypothetical protein